MCKSASLVLFAFKGIFWSGFYRPIRKKKFCYGTYISSLESEMSSLFDFEDFLYDGFYVLFCYVLLLPLHNLLARHFILFSKICAYKVVLRFAFGAMLFFRIF